MEGKGESGLVLGEGKRTEALRASRKNGKRQPQEVGGWGPSRMYRDLAGKRYTGLRGGNLR